MKLLREYIATLRKDSFQLDKPEGILILLFLIRPIYLLVPNTPLPAFPEMTYQVATYFIFLAFIELNIVYILYKKYKNTLTELLCWIAGGHLGQQITMAAITPSYSEAVWILVCIVYIFYIWKKRV